MIYLIVFSAVLIAGLVLFAFVLPSERYKEWIVLLQIYRQRDSAVWMGQGCNIDEGLILSNQYGGYFTPDAKYFFRVHHGTILVYMWADHNIYINTERWYDLKTAEKFIINKIIEWYNYNKFLRGTNEN